MARQCDDFLTAWVEHMDIVPAPELYRIWSGLGLISSALARRVWLANAPPIPTLYPNLFILLVGQPGTGKDMVIRPATRLILDANKELGPGKTTFMGGKSLSAKGLLDRLASDEAKQIVAFRDKGHKHVMEFQSISIILGELGTFLPEYDNRLVSYLNDLYNCDDEFEEQIRGGTALTKIENPHIMALLGTQPSTLAKTIPVDAFEQGLPARINFIYGSKTAKQPIRGKALNGRAFSSSRYTDLLVDFISIKNLGGEMKTTPDADDLINHFHITNGGGTQVPGARFKDYNERRALHLQKLSMCLSASESDDMLITKDHVIRAQEILFKAESVMPRIFENLVSARGFSREMEDILSLAEPDKTVLHSHLVRALARTRAPYEVGQIIAVTLETGMLRVIPNETPKRYKVILE